MGHTERSSDHSGGRAEVRRPHRAGEMRVRVIANDVPPLKYQQALKGSIMEVVEPQIRQPLAQ